MSKVNVPKTSLQLVAMCCLEVAGAYDTSQYLSRISARDTRDATRRARRRATRSGSRVSRARVLPARASRLSISPAFEPTRGNGATPARLPAPWRDAFLRAVARRAERVKMRFSIAVDCGAGSRRR